MAKRKAKELTSVCIDLKTVPMRKGLFAVAAATGETVTTIMRTHAYKVVKEAAEKGIIVLKEDGKD